MDPKNKKKILIGLVILAILAIVLVMVRSKATTTKTAKAFPRQCATITDCGYPDHPRGWYDVQKLGVANDFCRYVGNPPAYFSCALAGSTAQYSPAGAYDPTLFPLTEMKPGDRCYNVTTTPNPCPPAA